jgi:hypothetical protein
MLCFLLAHVCAVKSKSSTNTINKLRNDPDCPPFNHLAALLVQSTLTSLMPELLSWKSVRDITSHLAKHNMWSADRKKFSNYISPIHGVYLRESNKNLALREPSDLQASAINNSGSRWFFICCLMHE